MIIPTSWPRVRFFAPRNNWLCDGRPFLAREYFKTEAEANARRDSMRIQVRNGKAAPLTPAEGFEIARAEDLLKPFGCSIMQAVEAFVAQKEREAKSGNVTVAHALSVWRGEKQAAFDRGELAKATVSDIKKMAKLIGAAWGDRAVASMRAPEISKWIATLPYSARTRVNVRAKMFQFFHLCRVQEWIEVNPCDLVTSPKLRWKEVEIFTLEQCADLLKRITQGVPHVDASKSIKPDLECLPYALVSLFAGLRPGEAHALRWETIHWDTREIEVCNGKTTASKGHRFVPMNDTLFKLLLPFRQKIGRIIPYNFRKRWEAVRKGMVYPDNVLRHSFASYWLAMSLAGVKAFEGGRGTLAEIMGNSAIVIAESYRRAIPREHAEKFWSYFLDLDLGLDDRRALASASK